MEAINNLTVVCVEDDQFAREEMMYFLKKRVRSVYGAADGAEGLQQIRTYQPDVIIVDLLMPGMDGMTMIQKLREENRKVHIIIVTSVNSVDTVLESVDMGIDNYIVKPVSFSELEDKLKKISDIVQSERDGKKGIMDSVPDIHVAEDRVKMGVIKIFKEFTGRGPREAVVQLIGDEIVITMFGAMSVMEKNLLKSVRNYEVVKQLRNTVYESISGDVQKLLDEIFQREMILERVSIEPKKEIEQIVFEVRK